MIEQQQVTFVGLGLMGGSLALALRPFVERLTAVDSNPATVAAAVAQGVVDSAGDDLAAAVREADLLILATPVRTIIHLLGELPRLRPEGCLLLDLGSSKEAIVQAMDRLPRGFQAIGGHPMCGRASGGLAEATAALYRGQTFALCRSRRTTPLVEQVALQIVHHIGAHPLITSAERHDRLVALSSHLPYLLAALLTQQAAATAAVDEQLWPLTASGFQDTSRLAASDPLMMQDILLTNRTAVLAHLHQFQAGLAEVADLLEIEAAETLAEWLNKRQAEQLAYRKRKDNHVRPDHDSGGL
jgi:prephenate dehydrogenase